jgi:hypothetical protein
MEVLAHESELLLDAAQWADPYPPRRRCRREPTAQRRLS